MKFRDFYDMEVPQVALDFKFEDQSWHNDACARMTRDDLVLWVDWEDRSERELLLSSRFILVQVDLNNLEDDSGRVLLESESEEELRKSLTVWFDKEATD